MNSILKGTLVALSAAAMTLSAPTPASATSCGSCTCSPSLSCLGGLLNLSVTDLLVLANVKAKDISLVEVDVDEIELEDFLNDNSVAILTLQNILNNNTVIKNVLNQNNVSITDVLSVDVLNNNKVVIFHK